MAKTDWSWDQHKYKAKEWVNGKWQYIYNTAKNTSKKVQNKADQVSKSAKVYVNNAYNAGKAVAEKTYNNGRSAITTASNTIKDQTNNIIDKAQNKVNSEIDIIKQAREEAKKYIEENQKSKALPAAAIVGIGILSLIAARLIVTAASLLVASNEFAKQAKTWNDDNTKQREAAKSDDHPTKAQPMTDNQKQQIMDQINPKYNTKDSGWANNCYSCTLSYDLNRRGISSSAIYDTDGEAFDNIANCYQDAKNVDITASNPQKGFSKEESKEFVNNIINDYPDGAYGNLCLTWTPPFGLVGGHSIVWEKTDGKVIFRDCQSNTIYESEDDIYRVLRKSGYVNYFRADNLEISDKMASYVDVDDQVMIAGNRKGKNYDS